MPPSLSQWILQVLFCLLLIPSSGPAEAGVRYFAPDGTGSGITVDSPADFTQEAVRGAINSVYYSNPIDPEVYLVLASGTYNVKPITLTSISSTVAHLINAGVRLRISGTPETSGPTPSPTTLRLIDNLEGTSPEYYGFWKVNVLDIQQIAHLEISDLTIDCNFRGQPNHSSASATHPGAVSGLKVESETGRLCLWQLPKLHERRGLQTGPERIPDPRPNRDLESDLPFARRKESHAEQQLDHHPTGRPLLRESDSALLRLHSASGDS